MSCGNGEDDDPQRGSERGEIFDEREAVVLGEHEIHLRKALGQRVRSTRSAGMAGVCSGADHLKTALAGEQGGEALAHDRMIFGNGDGRSRAAGSDHEAGVAIGRGGRASESERSSVNSASDGWLRACSAQECPRSRPTMWVLVRIGFAGLVFLFRALWRRQGIDKSVIYRDTRLLTFRYETSGSEGNRAR